MRSQIAIPVKWESASFTKDDPDVFRFRHDRPLRWLQRLALWTLRKIGAHHTILHHEYTELRVDLDAFSELRRQLREHSLDGRGHPLCVVMGHKEFREIVSSAPARPACMILPDAILGVPLKVVPWMSGIVVVPK